MCDRKSRSPARRLFRDFTNIDDRIEKTVDELIDCIADLNCSAFRETYNFDLKIMQPCSSEVDLRLDTMLGRQIRHWWSWEAVNARLVPRFYRPVIIRSGQLEKNTIQASILPPITPLMPLQEPRISPPVKFFFRTVRRSRSVDAVKGKAFNYDLEYSNPPTVGKGQTTTDSVTICSPKRPSTK